MHTRTWCTSGTGVDFASKTWKGALQTFLDEQIKANKAVAHVNSQQDTKIQAKWIRPQGTTAKFLTQICKSAKSAMVEGKFLLRSK